MNALTSGAAAERKRIQAILESADAVDRGELARHLAFETDMAAPAAIALLGRSGKTRRVGMLAEMMGRIEQPNIRGEEPTAPAMPGRPDAAQIFHQRRLAHGQPEGSR